MLFTKLYMIFRDLSELNYLKKKEYEINQVNIVYYYNGNKKRTYILLFKLRDMM